jgi:acetyl esterase
MRAVESIVLYILAFTVTQTAWAQQISKPRSNSEIPSAPSEVFKTIGTTELKLYIFSPVNSERNRPAIVFFFGGGWKTGSPKQFEEQCRYLASRGMVAITADYRVASRHGVKAVDCVRDAKSAIRWVRAHSEKLGIDPDRIAASGGSAGGHLAACTATLTEFDEPEEDASISSVPNALILFNPAVALAEFDGDPSHTAAGRSAPAEEDLQRRLGVPPKSLSPTHHLSPKMPPTIMFFGTQDDLLAGAQFMQRSMKSMGNRCELITYEGEKHGFFNFGRGTGVHFRDTLLRTDRFLASLGWLTGEPDATALPR